MVETALNAQNQQNKQIETCLFRPGNLLELYSKNGQVYPKFTRNDRLILP